MHRLRSGKTPLLFVDAGGLLCKQPVPSRESPEIIQARAKGIARAMRAMQPAAIGIGSRELALGPDFLARLARENDLVFVSANLVDKKGALLFPAVRIVKAGSLTVAITGLTGQIPPNLSGSSAHLLSWRQALDALCRTTRDKADLLVLLSSLPPRINTTIAKEFPDIHIIIQAESASGNRVPSLVENTLLCQVAPKGKYLGVLDIQWSPSRSWQQKELLVLRSKKNEHDRINWKIGRLKRRLEGRQDQQTAMRLQQLQKKNEKLANEIRLLETRLRQQPPPSRYTNRFIALKSSLPEDKNVKEMIEATKGELNRLHRELRQSSSSATSNRKKNGKQLAGWTACGSCHPSQNDFYKTTDHFRAWQTLRNRKQEHVPECLACHVTLVAPADPEPEPRPMFSSLDEDLLRVGCESCHGPGQEHVRDPELHPMKRPTAAVCLRCHKGEHDRSFSFGEDLKKIRCPDMSLNP